MDWRDWLLLGMIFIPMLAIGLIHILGFDVLQFINTIKCRLGFHQFINLDRPRIGGALFICQNKACSVSFRLPANGPPPPIDPSKIDCSKVSGSVIHRPQQDIAHHHSVTLKVK